MYRFATESREHHERFQQRMHEEAKRMCSYMTEERTRVCREMEQRYQGKVKLEQLSWKEEQRAQDIRDAREKILRGNAQHQEKIAEVEHLKSALSDLIKESRNREVSLSGTVWTQNPSDGLREFIDQVDISEAEGLSALVMATTTTPRQE
eukprot:6226088-Amphidinium_carterae.1